MWNSFVFLIKFIIFFNETMMNNVASLNCFFSGNPHMLYHVKMFFKDFSNNQKEIRAPTIYLVVIVVVIEKFFKFYPHFSSLLVCKQWWISFFLFKHHHHQMEWIQNFCLVIRYGCLFFFSLFLLVLLFFLRKQKIHRNTMNDGWIQLG